MLTALGLLAVLGLILLNGYFVAAEFAYVAVRRGRLEELAEEGDRRAATALRVLERLSFMLSGAQLGITVTSLVVGFIADRTLGRAIQPLLALFGLPEQASLGVAIAVGFVIATGTQMVIGELAPKNLAIARPEAFSLGLARSTWLFMRIAGPIIRFFDNASNALLRRLGIEPVEELTAGVSPEELGHIIEESGRQGALSEPQAALLSRALAFRELRAADAMVPRPQVQWIAADATCDELRQLAVATGFSRFPVVGDGLDDVVGVVQAKAIFQVSPAERSRTRVRSLAHRAVAVPESALLGPLLADLRDAQTQLALVVDEHGGTAGSITLEDIVEELVGTIQDEHDPAEPVVRDLGDGSFLVPGSWRLDETERATGLTLPDGDYDTLSGLVMDRLGRVPAAGDVVETPTATVHVEELAGMAVGAVRLVPCEPGEDEDEEGGR
jgi:CBS domain containing-hemolysin-like protein